MMEHEYIIGLAITIILGLIGLVYRALTGGIKENKDSIKEVAEKTDGRLDKIEKDVAVIDERTKK